MSRFRINPLIANPDVAGRISVDKGLSTSQSYPHGMKDHLQHPLEAEAMSETTAAKTPKKRRFRIIRILGILALLLVVLILAAPWIVANTGLRDQVINAILASPSVTASSEGASFGWFSPLAVRGLNLKSSNDRIDIRVENITADRPPLQMLTSVPDLGTITVEKPHVQVQLPLDVKLELKEHLLEPLFTANVKDAALTVRLAGQDEPAIHVDGINLTVRVEEAEGGRVLTLDPMVVFDRRKLSPKLASKALHLINPSLGDAPEVAGEVTLSLDKLRMPLGIPKEKAVKQIEMEGKLGLHQVSMDVKNPMGQLLVQLVADMNGKQVSEVVRLVQDAEVRFKVHEGRMYHEGLRIGFPDIDPALVVTSRGSVGLDKTLDLYVEVPRLDKALRKAKGPAKCRITGTISNPKVAIQDASFVLRQHDQKEPIIAVHGIDLNMQVEDTASGRVLAVAPFEVCKKAKLDVGLAGGLVKLLVPDLHRDQDVSGEISLALQTLRVPLGVARDQLVKRLEAEGTLTLHKVATEAKSPMFLAVLKVLDDMHGKQSSKMIRLVDESTIHFKVRDGRLHHDGLRVGLPDIDPELVLSSRGSIGLDETLDLKLELPRLDRAQQKAKGAAKCHITGTISNPKVSVQNASFILRQHDRKEPIIAVNGIDLNMQVENTSSGRVLAFAPVEICKKSKIGLGLAGGLVQWLVPDIHKGQEVTGEVSLSLKTLRIPFGVGKDELVKHMEVDGTLTLHQFGTEARNPMWQALLKLLDDMHGKHATKMIHFVGDSEIHFQVREGRLFHEGLRVGLPDIDPALVVSSRGSIGADESLDLHLELPRLLKGKQKEGTIKCNISGTIRDPKIALLGASLVVRLSGDDKGKAALKVDNVDLNFSVQTGKDGRMLTLAPVTLIKGLKLTPEVNHEILRLIAPSLDDLTAVKGEISLSLDKFRVPLGVSKSELIKKVELAGKLELREIIVAVKTPLLKDMVKIVANMYRKKPSDTVRFVKDDAVRFEVRGGRVYHEGLRFGFPDISPKLMISSRGSVGLDKSLDLVLEVPRILLKQGTNSADIVAQTPVRFRVTGSIGKPVVTQIK
jgi:hypothetical protein